MPLDPIEVDQLEASIQRSPSAFTFSRILSIAIEALSNRFLIWVATLGGMTLWGLTVYDPSWIRIVSVIGYCAFVLIPLIWRDSKESPELPRR